MKRSPLKRKTRLRKTRKASPIKAINNRLWDKAKTVVRMRDGDICQHCGKRCTGRMRHNSHVISRSYKRVKYDPWNLKILCASCHDLWGKKPTIMSKWFAQKFPERDEYLRRVDIALAGRGTIHLSDYEWMEERLDLMIEDELPQPLYHLAMLDEQHGGDEPGGWE